MHHVLCHCAGLPDRRGAAQSHPAHCGKDRGGYPGAGARLRLSRGRLRRVPGRLVRLARCLAGLRRAVGEKLLLVTLRTRAEGGEADAALPEYAAFCRRVWDGGCADLIDIEFLTAGDGLPDLIAEAHARGVAVVCSSHDFFQTPPEAEMTARLRAMHAAGADLPKLAVMPRSRRDVLALLSATAALADEGVPVITMSMGALGAVSRLCGEAMGSAMTFASAGKASAPGQIALDALNPALDALALG